MRRGSTALYLFREQYEPELLHLADLAEEGSTVLDVGANLGVYTVVAAKLVGPRGRVIAIEPSVGTFELLRRNVELNDLHNVTLVNKAITDQVGQARLYHVAGAPNYSLAAPAGTLPTHEVVETQPLDALVAELGVTDISCVKIDVEGAEHLVISGARECLGHWHPSVIFEVNDENAGRFGASSADVLARLRECGYRFGVLAGGGIVPLHGAPRTGNVVARHGARERSPRPDGRAADTAGTACPYSAPMETER